MIKDPIEIISNAHWRAVTENNLGKTIFINGDSALSLVSIHRGRDYPLHVIQHFMIFKAASFGLMYKIEETTYTKEDFISIMSVKHPRHLEWLLFHPEWLD